MRNRKIFRSTAAGWLMLVPLLTIVLFISHPALAASPPTNVQVNKPFDGGKTFPCQGLLDLSAFGKWAEGDPWVAFDSRGNAYYGTLAFDTVATPPLPPTADVFVAKSTDGGCTWPTAAKKIFAGRRSRTSASLAAAGPASSSSTSTRPTSRSTAGSRRTRSSRQSSTTCRSSSTRSRWRSAGTSARSTS